MKYAICVASDKWKNLDMAADSIIVVAHPDDEVLWFSSLLTRIDHILFCFTDVPGNARISEGRRALAKAYPVTSVTRLDLPETGALNKADWRMPVITKYGLELTSDSSACQGYETGYPELCERLQQALEGYRRVYTHNPWGEYGHEEHVQVCHAVTDVQMTLGFECWHSGYYSSKSHQLMQRYDLADAPFEVGVVNHELQDAYKALYLEHGCWTWYDDLATFDSEYFYPNVSLSDDGNRTVSGSVPLNRVRIDAEYAIYLGATISLSGLAANSGYVVPMKSRRHVLGNKGGQYSLIGEGSLRDMPINDSAALVFELCDGERSVRAITDIIGDAYGGIDETMEMDICHCLLDLRRRGIVSLYYYPSDSTPTAGA